MYFNYLSIEGEREMTDVYTCLLHVSLPSINVKYSDLYHLVAGEYNVAI